MAGQITESSGNIFQDLGFEKEEATNLKIRADLMMTLRRMIREKGLRQHQVAKLLETTQPRVSDLMNGKIDRFSIDTLVNMLSIMGVQIRLDLESTDNGSGSSFETESQHKQVHF